MKKLQYKINDEWLDLYEVYKGPGVPKNNEIWYKTSDNQPINIKNNMLNYNDYVDGDDELNILSNEYDPVDDCCKIICEKDIKIIPGIRWEDDEGAYNIASIFYPNENKVTEIIYLPSSIEYICDAALINLENASVINIDTLINLKQIGGNFLSHCNLQSIDLTSLYNVEHIGYYFLSECKKLKSIDLSPFNNTKIIEHNFLNNCTELTKIDLSSLQNLENNGWNLEMGFRGCTNLKTFIVNVPNKSLTYLFKNSYGNGYQNADSIYVNDELLEEYKTNSDSSWLADKFKPLSEYKQE